MLDGLETAALAVAVVGVYAGADHQFTLVRLADVPVHGVGHDHGIEHRLQRLRNECLQRVTFDRETQTRHRREHTGIAGNDDADFRRADRTACRFHARHLAALAADAGHLALLDDVHATGVSRTGETPCNCVVPRNAGAALQRGAQYRVARIRRSIDERNRLADLLGADHFGIDPVQPIRVDAALDVAHVLQRMAEVVHAALTEHDVVVEILAQPLPEFHGMLVEQRSFGPEVIRPHDRRVAAGVATTDPAFFEHGDIADAVFLREVVRGSQAVTATADNDHVVLPFRLRAAPGLAPLSIVADRIANETESGILTHYWFPAGSVRIVANRRRARNSPMRQRRRCVL